MLVDKVTEQIQTQAKQNEKQFIDQLLEQVQSQTSDYEEKNYTKNN